MLFLRISPVYSVDLSFTLVVYLSLFVLYMLYFIYFYPKESMSSELQRERLLCVARLSDKTNRLGRRKMRPLQSDEGKQERAAIAQADTQRGRR